MAQVASKSLTMTKRRPMWGMAISPIEHVTDNDEAMSNVVYGNGYHGASDLQVTDHDEMMSSMVHNVEYNGQ
jgi:hypothetical protein